MFRKKSVSTIILSLLLMLSLTIGVYASTNTLSVTHVYQAKDMWCWAASGEMVGSYQNDSAGIDQWDIVRHIKGSIFNRYPNVGGSDSNIVEAVEYASDDTVDYTYSSIISLSSHETHIDNGDPIVMKIHWNGGGNHAVVCSGYKNDYLYVVDPWENTTKAYYDYTDLKNGTTIQTGTGEYITSFHKN